MAGDWIKMRSNLWDDPRVSRLCDITGAAEAPIIGALYWLWATADQHSVDGAMSGLTLRQIDRKTGVPGFGAAMCEIGWLRDDSQGVVIAGFEEHNGASAKKRCQTAKRVANHKAGNASLTLADDDGNAESVTSALPREREEKRREEGNTQPPVGGCSAESSDSPPKAKRAGLPDCPHQRILALWAEVLPAMPQHNPDMWDGSRADSLRQRWRETAQRKGWATQDEGVAYFRKLFAYIGTSEFLIGQKPAREPGGRPFVADLEFVVTASKWRRLHEGKYHNELEEAAA